MDLKKIDTLKLAEDGFKHTFLMPNTNEETDIVVDLFGVGSKAYKEAVAKRDEYFRKNNKITEESLQTFRIQILAKCTRGWEGIEETDETGKVGSVKFSYDEAVRIYSEYPLLADQVDTAIHSVVERLEKN